MQTSVKSEQNPGANVVSFCCSKCGAPLKLDPSLQTLPDKGFLQEISGLLWLIFRSTMSVSDTGLGYCSDLARTWYSHQVNLQTCELWVQYHSACMMMILDSCKFSIWPIKDTAMVVHIHLLFDPWRVLTGKRITILNIAIIVPSLGQTQRACPRLNWTILSAAVSPPLFLCLLCVYHVLFSFLKLDEWQSLDNTAELSILLLSLFVSSCYQDDWQLVN